MGTMLGGGGEGEVWKAVLPLSTDGRATVAVKIMRTPPADDVWEKTGNLLRTLSHPGLVRVTQVFIGPERHLKDAADLSSRVGYVVMDYVEGINLREWCDENPDATVGERIRMLRAIAAALDEMHSGARTNVPVAHGDVKPANIVVRPDGGTVLVDLGLARLADATGVMGRSPVYAAPELRIPGAMATPAADRYAFAATTAQVLLGHPLPATPAGWLDEQALMEALHRNPRTARRQLLIRHILQSLATPAEARTHGSLGRWLDSAAESLTVTTDTPAVPATTPIPTTAGLDAVAPAGVAATGLLPPEPFGTMPPGAPEAAELTWTGQEPIGPPPDPQRFDGWPASGHGQLPPPSNGAWTGGSGHGRSGRRPAWVVPAAIAGVVVVLIVAVVTSVSLGGGSGGGDVLAGQTGGVTQSPTAVGEPTAAGFPTPSASATPTYTPSPTTDGGVNPATPTAGSSGLPTAPIYLTDLNYVEKDEKADFESYENEPADISGHTYGHALSMGDSCSRGDGGDYWVDFDISRQWETFTAVVGVTDKSPAATSVTYTVFADTHPISSGTLTLGKAVPINVSVHNVLRLRFLYHDPTALTNSCSLPRPWVAWGDPVLHPASNLDGSPA
jgi:serine/threonine protein kinase